MSFESGILDAVDARTKLAGYNRMEILLFSLGTDEVLGINVFKVREVIHTPAITKTPNVPRGVEGFISLRGNIIPVIALDSFINSGRRIQCDNQILIVTEFSRHTQGFLVHSVDRIIRIDWDKVKPPQGMLASNEGLITAITELPGGKLVSLLDVEQVLAFVIGEQTVPHLERFNDNIERYIFFADDSQVARRHIVAVLDRMGVMHQQANNGAEAWEKLKSMAARAQQDGRPLHETLRLILTDAEMPEMDGYMLTKHIKSDRRFDGIPVVMYSSLSSRANQAMGMEAGVDAYVPKFDPIVLSQTLRPLLV